MKHETTTGRVSVGVELGTKGHVGKVDAYIEFFTDWRGELYRVEFRCDRYTVSTYDELTGERGERLTDWRYWATSQGGGAVKDRETHYSTAGMTDTARTRLDERLRDEAGAILATIEATPAWRKAIARAVADEVKKCTYSSARDLFAGRYLPIHGETMGARLVELIGLYAAALDAAKDACDKLQAEIGGY